MIDPLAYAPGVSPLAAWFSSGGAVRRAEATLQASERGLTRNVGTSWLMPTVRSTIRRLPKGPSVVRTQELEAAGFTRRQVRDMAADGRLTEVARGLYARSAATTTEHRTLVEAQQRVPGGVVCLLSALRFHGLGTQNPSEVWIAIDVKARKPAASAIPIRLVRFSGRALTFGVEGRVLEGKNVRITSPAKTVADTFKYRNKIGLDIALEATRAYLSRRGRSIDELLEAAAVCRVAKVMQPYIEAMT